MGKWKSESGVALMIVLASLLIVSTVVVEFAYNAHVAYSVATTLRNRMKAYYLAQSAMNLTRLQLSKERQMRQQFASLLSEMSGTGVSNDPFCKMFPLSTQMIQGIASGSVSLGEEGLTQGGEEETGGGEQEGGDLFNLGGDFEGKCDTEEGKINLNAFRPSARGVGGVGVLPGAFENEEGAVNPAASRTYENQKSLLVSLLTQPEFEKTSGGSVDSMRKIATAIADWVDLDDRINEAAGLQGGYEDADYSDLPYKPKNGKFATKAELLLIPNLGDELFQLMEPSVTVYGDDKINICQSSDETIRAFLQNYSQTTPGAFPFNPNDETRVASLIDAIREACSQPNPRPAQIAQVITSALGGQAGTEQAGTGEEGGEVTEGRAKGRRPKGGGSGLASQIRTENRFYSLEATGTVGEIEVRIRSVLDTNGTNPNLWKILYYRVE
ncbi:MAG: general secretion pathway protein GspK [Deltaproteobacteria bacterium]|nr:general secretion pathway protein GspK [Deltaproteobacteria bacterium]